MKGSRWYLRNHSRKLLFDTCSYNTNFLCSWAFLKFIVCIYICYQVALHPHFVHTLHVLKLMLICKCFLQVVNGNYKYTQKNHLLLNTGCWNTRKSMWRQEFHKWAKCYFFCLYWRNNRTKIKLIHIPPSQHVAQISNLLWIQINLDS